MVIVIVNIIVVLSVIATMAVLIKHLKEDVGSDELMVVSNVDAEASNGGLAEWIDGAGRGYGIATGGWVLSVPPVRSVERIDIRPLEMRLDLSDVRTRDGARVPVSGLATVTVDMTPRRVEQFVEMFLGRSRDEIVGAVQKTLESHIRDVASMLDADEMATRRDEVSERIAKTIGYDLESLGLELESLSIDGL